MLNKLKPGSFKYWLPVAFCAGLIFYSSSLPGTSIPRLFLFQDILFHFFIYSILGLFFSRAFQESFSGIRGIKIIIFTFIFTFFYGISDEFHQYFVPNRNVSFFDVFVDGLGGLSGAWFKRWLK
jgi:VanZ family protein